MPRPGVVALVALLLCIGSGLAFAGQGGREGDKSNVDFAREVAPILVRHCLECHDSASLRGGLDLSRMRSAAAGGDSGPAWHAGDADGSEMITSVESGEMPLDRPPLSDDDRGTLRRWVDQGAEWTLPYVDPAIYRDGFVDPMIVARRLTAAEYRAGVRAALGVDVSDAVAEHWPPQSRADGFSNTAYNLTVGLRHIEAYWRLATDAAERTDVDGFAARYGRDQTLTDKNSNRSLIDLR